MGKQYQHQEEVRRWNNPIENRHMLKRLTGKRSEVRIVGEDVGHAGSYPARPSFPTLYLRKVHRMPRICLKHKVACPHCRGQMNLETAPDVQHAQFWCGNVRCGAEFWAHSTADGWEYGDEKEREHGRAEGGEG